MAMRRSALFGSGAITAQGAAKLHFAESEFIAEAIGDLGELLKFFALAGLQQIELLLAVSEGAEAHSQKAHLALAIEVVEEKLPKDGVDAGVKRRGFGESFRTCVCIE